MLTTEYSQRDLVIYIYSNSGKSVQDSRTEAAKKTLEVLLLFVLLLIVI